MIEAEFNVLSAKAQEYLNSKQAAKGEMQKLFADMKACFEKCKTCTGSVQGLLPEPEDGDAAADETAEEQNSD
eukprot:7648008-Karenia_brevis.AAC.1